MLADAAIDMNLPSQIILACAAICAAINFLLLLVIGAKGGEASPYASRRPFVKNQNYFLLTVFFGVDLDGSFYQRSKRWMLFARLNLLVGVLLILGFFVVQFWFKTV